jgi:glucokinase
MHAGDAIAQEICDSALDALAFSFSHLVAVVAPEVIVIGGGLSNAGDVFFAPLERRLRALLTYQPMPELRPAKIGADAGAIGAALLARDAAAAS